MSSFILPIIGGILIGLSASLLLYLNGRVMGVSGIVRDALLKRSPENRWRVAFILGLLFGGFIVRLLWPYALEISVSRNLGTLAIAGVLVGFGTSLGSGCTSGHGICGLSRLSPRSVVATLTFIAFGILSASLFRLITGSPGGS